jgi:hypothetical protein
MREVIVESISELDETKRPAIIAGLFVYSEVIPVKPV